jgi:hypothetical protein
MTKKKYAAYIYSTLTAAQLYTNYGAGGGDLPTIEGEGVLIQGGANIPDKFFRAPDGAVVTPVTQEEMEYLQQNSVFKLHEKNGFIIVKDKMEDGEKVAADMQTRDKSAPQVDADFKEGEEPKTNTEPKNSRKA